LIHSTGLVTRALKRETPLSGTQGAQRDVKLAFGAEQSKVSRHDIGDHYKRDRVAGEDGREQDRARRFLKAIETTPQVYLVVAHARDGEEVNGAYMLAANPASLRILTAKTVVDVRTLTTESAESRAFLLASGVNLQIDRRELLRPSES
jgi:hypothetical protein